MTVFIGSRYESCKVHKHDDNYHLSHREPLVRKDFDDNIIHVVKEGERLDLIAYKYWLRPDLFYIICDWNDIYNPLKQSLEPGSTLILPSFEKVIGGDL